MKPKLLLGLALILGVVALGCSTAKPNSPSSPTQTRLRFVQVDSEETDGEDGHGKNAVDGDPDTIWHTQWNKESPGLPHEIILQLLPPSVIVGFTYLPRQDASDHGTIQDYEFFVSDDGSNFGQPVKTGSFDSGKAKKTETFPPVKCAFVKLRAVSEINHLSWTSAAEIGVIQIGGEPSIPAKPHQPKPHPSPPMTMPLPPANWQTLLRSAPTLGDVRGS